MNSLIEFVITNWRLQGFDRPHLKVETSELHFSSVGYQDVIRLLWIGFDALVLESSKLLCDWCDRGDESLLP